MFRSPQKGGRRPPFALVPLPCPPSFARCAARPSGGRRRWHRLPPVSCPSAGTDRTILTQKALKFLRLHRHAPQPVKGRPLLSWRLPVIQRFCRRPALPDSRGESFLPRKEFLSWCQEGEASLEKRQSMFHARLQEVERQMEDLQKMINTLKFKCWYYDTAVAAGSEAAVKELPPDRMPEDIREYRI